MKKNSLQSYKVQCRTKTDLKTTNQIPKSPLRKSSLVVVQIDVLNVCTGILPVRTGKNEQSIIMRHNYLHNEQAKVITTTIACAQISKDKLLIGI